MSNAIKQEFEFYLILYGCPAEVLFQILLSTTTYKRLA